jgi:tRNA modification GTPase
MKRIAPKDSDTICAESTPTGRGGISVIRISGDRAWEIAINRSPQLNKKTIESHRCYFSKFVDQDGAPLDEVLVTFFEANKSFTGDRVVEISCHGNPLIVDSILRSLIATGARAAERGEFTYRAFMNGKIDLVQAESVLGLIESNSKKSAQLSLRQLGGYLSEKLIAFEDTLVWCLAHLEASIDFSTEDIEVVDHSLLRRRLVEVHSGLATMLATFEQGKSIAHGFRLVIVGAPNVGKSSLLNLLLQKDRAIVTDIAGTTRDLIEDSFVFEGQLFTIVDTAGVRESVDVVEKIGIERSLESLSQSDAVLFVYDSSSAATPQELDLLARCLDKEPILVGNKKDLSLGRDAFLDSLNEKNFQKLGEIDVFPRVLISCFEEQDGTALKRLILEAAKLGAEDLSVVLSNSRHFESLTRAHGCIDKALSVLKAEMGAEFVALELKDALLRIQETLGHRYDDQILDRVFKEFCLGK